MASLSLVGMFLLTSGSWDFTLDGYVLQMLVDNDHIYWQVLPVPYETLGLLASYFLNFGVFPVLPNPA